MPSSRKSCCRATNGIANLGDRLLTLLDVLDQLDGALVALFHVVAGIFVVGIASEQAFVSRIETKLGNVIFVHHHQPLVAMLHEGNVGLDQPGLR